MTVSTLSPSPLWPSCPCFSCFKPSGPPCPTWAVFYLSPKAEPTREPTLAVVGGFKHRNVVVVVVQLLSCVRLFATARTATHQASLSFTMSWSLPKLMSIESLMSSDISSSVVRFSSCLQSFPASWSFLMGQFFASGGQSVGASASASVLPMNIQNYSNVM